MASIRPRVAATDHAQGRTATGSSLASTLDNSGLLPLVLLGGVQIRRVYAHAQRTGGSSSPETLVSAPLAGWWPDYRPPRLPAAQHSPARCLWRIGVQPDSSRP